MGTIQYFIIEATNEDISTGETSKLWHCRAIGYHHTDVFMTVEEGGGEKISSIRHNREVRELR